MKTKIIGSIFIAIALLLAVIIPVGVFATGEQAQSTTMHISDNMMTLLKKLEGFNPHAYWDYKQWSIGYGSKCPAGKEWYYREDGEGHTISEEYATELLLGELEYFERELNGFIDHFDLTLSQNEYDALVSFSYNVGASWMRNSSGQYKSSGNLNSAIISGDAGTRMFYGIMLWGYAGNEYILIPRRASEMNVFANGVYSQNVDAVYPSRYRVAFMDGNGGTVSYYGFGFDAQDPIALSEKTSFKEYPTGPDEHGATVTYVFDGWYTEREGGTKVETMDANIETGTVLYAHWKTPGGTPVTVPQQETGLKLTVHVTNNGVNIRSGPQTYYQAVGKANIGDTFVITDVARGAGMNWGRFGDKWIALKYTDYDDALAQTLPIWGKVTASTLKIREDAGTDYNILGNKAKDDLVLITQFKSGGDMWWGKIEEGWVALPYITFDGVTVDGQTVQSVALHQNPTKLSYVHKTENLDLTGAKLKVTFTDSSTQIVDITPEMVTGFDNTTVGTKTLTVTYQGFQTNLDVQIVKPKVIFQMDDGTVITETEYLVGDTIQIPENPTKATDSNGYYVFTRWTPEVSTTCNGNAVYKAVFERKELVGDLNGDTFINDRDAIYLLGYVLFPNDYPVKGTADMNQDGFVNDRDAIYLLGHVLFPNDYPLPK